MTGAFRMSNDPTGFHLRFAPDVSQQSRDSLSLGLAGETGLFALLDRSRYDNDNAFTATTNMINVQLK